jgi:chromosome partitioning protein
MGPGAADSRRALGYTHALCGRRDCALETATESLHEACVFNQKGGVGKTSITCNLAAIDASLGRRTLVIDLDVQGNTTHYLVGEIDAEAFPAEAQGVSGLFKQTVGPRRMGRNPDAFVWETPYENLYLMPSSPTLPSWSASWSRATRSTSCATPWSSSPTSTTGSTSIPRRTSTFSQKSALIAADRVLIPFDCDSFARQSLYSLMDNIAELREDHNDALAVEGIVINQFNSQARLPGELVAELRPRVIRFCPPTSVRR